MNLSMKTDSVKLAVLLFLFVGIIVFLLADSKAQAVHQVHVELYVSPNGSGSICSLEDPCTLETARNQARLETATMSGDIVIWLKGGRYELEQTFELDWQDSGQNGFDVIYRAYGTEEPVISGGVEITGWTEVGSGVWKANVPGIDDMRHMFVNGERAIRARSAWYPNGYTRTEHGFLKPANALNNEPVIEQVEVVMIVGWRAYRCRVGEIDGQQIHLTEPCWTNSNLHRFQPNRIAWIENAMQFLDEPGEFYFNQQSNELFYIPRPGEDLQVDQVIVPVLDTLISGKGTAVQPIRNIRFEGLAFSHSTWLGVHSDEGYASLQAGFRRIGDVQVLFETWEKMKEGLVFEYATHIGFTGNTFTQMGSAGLGMGRGTQHSEIIGNRFYDISGSGIQLGSIYAEDYRPTLPASEVRDVRIQNNYIHHVSNEYLDAVGIWVGYAKNVDISHNEVAHLPYSAISVGWGWGNAQVDRPGNPAFSGDHRIANNKVHDIMNVLNDGGGLYTLGNMPGTVIEGNYIFNNKDNHISNNSDARAIYLDMGSGNIVVRNNVAFDNAINFVVKGYDHHITNNYWDDETQHKFLYDEGDESVYEHNHVVTDGLFPLPILLNAGLEPDYEHLLGEAPGSNVTMHATAMALEPGGEAVHPDVQVQAAMDQNSGTAAYADEPWTLQLLLDRAYDLSALVLRFKDNIPERYKVETTLDGGTWVEQVTDITDHPNNLIIVSGPARGVRITSLAGAMGIAEVEVYAEGMPVPVIEGEYLNLQVGESNTVIVAGDAYVSVDGMLLRGIQVGHTTLDVDGHPLELEVQRYKQLVYETEKTELAINRSMDTRLWAITEDGARRPVDQVSYESDNVIVLSVDATTGRATGHSAGTANLTANKVMYVNSPELISIGVEMHVYQEQLEVVDLHVNHPMNPGDTTTAHVSGYYNSGYEADLQDAVIVYTSSRPDVAAIDAAGMITALQEGQATITAEVTMGQVTREASLEVFVYPEGWSSLLIGEAEGTAIYRQDDSWLIQASGENIWNQADHFIYVYQTVDMADYPFGISIIGTVEAISDHVSPSTMTGLMLRNHLGPDSKNVNYRVHASGGAVDKNVPLTRRMADGETSSHNNTPSLSLPATLRLSYYNNTAYAHYWNEADEVWEAAGYVLHFQLDEQFTIGFAHASHRSNEMTETTVSGVQIVSAEDIVDLLIPPLHAEINRTTLPIGETAQITVEHADPDETVTYTSLNPGIATVDATGEVTGVGYGVATIEVTATHHAGAWEPRTAQVSIWVYDPEAEYDNVALNKPSGGYTNDWQQPLNAHQGRAYSNGNDGNLETAAQANGQRDWIYQIDLLEQHDIHAFEVAFIHVYATEYEIWGSLDGDNWTKFIHRTDGEAYQNKLLALPEPSPMRYIALRAIKPDGPGQVGGQMAVAHFGALALVEQEEQLPLTAEINRTALPIGETAQITVEHADPDETVTFTSWNPGIATVDATGEVTGVGYGVATIEVTATHHAGAWEPRTAQVWIWVYDPEAEYDNVALNKPSGGYTNDWQQPLNAHQGRQYHNGNDGNLETAAQANGQRDWIYQIDLLEQHDIHAFEVAFIHVYATEYEIWGSLDGNNWTKFIHRTDGEAYQNKKLGLPEPTPMRYIALRAIKPDGPGQEGGQMAVAHFGALAVEEQEELLPLTAEINRTALPIGETAQITVEHVDPDETVTYTSLNPGIATVDATGEVTGVGYGVATIEVTATHHTGAWEPRTAQVWIWVYDPEAEYDNVALNKPSGGYTNDWQQPLNAHQGRQYHNGNDGNLETAAQANGQRDWIYQIDLLEQHDIHAFEVAFIHVYATEYEIWGSLDGDDWTKFIHRTDGEAYQNKLLALPEPSSMRYIALRAIKPDGPGQEGGQMAVAHFGALRPVDEPELVSLELLIDKLEADHNDGLVAIPVYRRVNALLNIVARHRSNGHNEQAINQLYHVIEHLNRNEYDELVVYAKQLAELWEDELNESV